jgi:hypothetical protein
MSPRFGPCSASLQSPLDLSSCRALFCHRPKSRSLALSDLDYPPPLVSKHPLIPALIACVPVLEPLLPWGELDGPVWHSGLSGFPILEPSCPVGGRCSSNGRLLCSGLHGQNPQRVLTISGGRALAVESMNHTTPPKVGKVDTSSTEAPAA